MARIEARLTALTDGARTALNGSQCFEINCFPFLIGRNERIRVSQGKEYVAERRRHDSPPVNHCYLIENHTPMYISREHFALDCLGDKLLKGIEELKAERKYQERFYTAALSAHGRLLNLTSRKLMEHNIHELLKEEDQKQ